jgi:DNA-binding response OmpR family regulator
MVSMMIPVTWSAMTPRILIADDDDDLRQLLRLMLSREGFEIIEAQTGPSTGAGI